MLKKLLFCILMLAAFLGFTQIPNAGFESVTGSKPNNYNLGPTYSLYPIRDTLSPKSGLHAAAIYGSIPPAYPGAVISEHLLGPTLPVSLSGWYKYYPQLGDSIVFSLGVYKTGNIASYAPNVPTVITASTAIYTQFTVPINYTSYGFASCDSAFIIIYTTGNVSQGGYNWPHPNTIAVFDDLAWNYSVTAVAEVNKDVLINAESVSPNPAKEFTNIVYTVSDNCDVSLKLYDVTGKEVRTVIDKEPQRSGRYKAEIELNGLQSGIYLCEFTTSSGYKVTKKLVKQ
jgi:hypothetical protein